MSDLSGEERYELQRRAGEAERLLQDPELWNLLTFIKAGALHRALNGHDFREREEGRHLALAVDHLALELKNRIEVPLTQVERDKLARRYE